MDHSSGSLCSDHKYCSVMTEHERHSCRGQIAKPDPFCRCSFRFHPPWITAALPIPQRCSWVGHSSCFPDITHKPVNTLERFSCCGLLTVHSPVLSRREPDGFYYRGTLKQELEGEKGMFLVEFYKQNTIGEKYQTFLQKTASDDIIDYSDAIRHCIVPCDKVLAPWEADFTRYGPGTVIQGIETRDPLRVTEDEEVTVSFWNGKKAKVPLGVAVWIPSTVWDRIVMMIHLPLSSRQQQQLTEKIPSTTTYVFTDRFSTVPMHTCNSESFYRHKWPCNLVPPHYSHPHIGCHVPVHTRCSCCSHSEGHNWWPLSPTPTIHVKDSKEQEFDPKATQLRTEPEWTKMKADLSSSSSSSVSSYSSNDNESDKETCLTRSTMVDSAVNTDSSLWEKHRVKAEEGGRPDWKYWKRSHPEPHHRKPGSSVSTNRFTDRRFDLEPTSFSGSDLSPAGPTNQSSMFETIPHSPIRRLTMKDVLSHSDFRPSPGPQGHPLVEQLGENQIEQEKQKQVAIEHLRRKKLQHQKWESKREQQAEQQYNETQEHHRKKTLQHLKNEDLKLKEQAIKRIQAMKAKQLTQQITSQRMQTMSEEDKQKEQRRLAHLQNVREKIDEKEFRKCKEAEIKEMETMEARRRRLDDHYRQMAGKVFQDETPSGGSRRKDIVQQI